MKGAHKLRNPPGFGLRQSPGAFLTSPPCSPNVRTSVPVQCTQLKLLLFLAALLLIAQPCFAKPRDERPYPQMKRAPTPFVIITNTVHIPTASKFNPVFWFENYDRPIPPPDYRPNERFRRFKWHIRNPFHNFDFYVIGIADKTFVREGRYPAKVFAPEGGWNWAICKYKFLRLPFVSYSEGRFNFYSGWRNRGQFGFELKYSKPKTSTVKPAVAAP